MAETSDVSWLVARGDDIAQLQQALDPIDAVIEETWPAAANAGVIALVRVARADADAATDAVPTEISVFDTEDGAREAAQELAATA